MPPAKKKQRLDDATSSHRDDKDLTLQLVRCLSREQLESFVKDSVSSGTPISMEALWTAVPEHAAEEVRRSRPSPGVISRGNERVGTGSFDGLDQEIMKQIFSYLSLPMKITCVTSVCKAWRGYKTSIPGIFTDLSEKLADTFHASKYNKVAFARALLDWVPDQAGVEAFRISISETCDLRHVSAFLKQLQELKVATAKQGKTFRLKKFVLQGAKFTSDVLERVAKHEICSSLASLVIHNVYDINTHAITNLLQKCPLLEELVVPQYLMGHFRPNLSCHLRSLSAARSGAPLLLTSLDLTHGSVGGRGALNWQGMSKLGEYLPLLRVLKLMEISYGTPVQSALNAPVFQPASPLEDFLPEPFVLLPHLKVFSLERVIGEYVTKRYELYPRYATTSCVTKILMRLLDAMPMLEVLTFKHGSYRNENQAVIPPIPQVDFSVISFPERLKRLTFDYTVLIDPIQFCTFFKPSLDQFHFAFYTAAYSEPPTTRLRQQFPRLRLYHWMPPYDGANLVEHMMLTTKPASVWTEKAGSWAFVD